MQNLVPKIMGWLIVIITLALAPTINTSNAAITAAVAAATNNTTMIGIATVSAFGAPLIIIGLLVAGGMFGVAGVKGKLQGATTRDMMEVIGAVILVIVVMSLFTNVITYVDTLITASSGFAQTIYGVIPIVLYVGIIAGTGGTIYAKYRSAKGKDKKSKSSANY